MRGHISFFLLAGLAASLAFRSVPVMAQQPSVGDEYTNWDKQLTKDIAEIERVANYNNAWNQQHGDTVRLLNSYLRTLGTAKIPFPAVDDTDAHAANYQARMQRKMLMLDAAENLKKLETDPNHPIKSLAAFKQDFEALLAKTPGFTSEEEDVRKFAMRALKEIEKLSEKPGDLPTRGSQLRPVTPAADIQEMKTMLGSVRQAKVSESKCKLSPVIRAELATYTQEKATLDGQKASAEADVRRLQGSLANDLIGVQKAHEQRLDRAGKDRDKSINDAAFFRDFEIAQAVSPEAEAEALFNFEQIEKEAKRLYGVAETASSETKRKDDTKLHEAITAAKQKVTDLSNKITAKQAKVSTWTSCLTARENLDSRVHALKVSVTDPAAPKVSDQKATHDGVKAGYEDITRQIGPR